MLIRSTSYFFLLCAIINLMSVGEKILGVDFGERKIGLAISDGSLAEPFSIIESGNQEGAIQEIAKICEREKIQKIVLGMPDGSQKVRNFGQKLSKKTDLRIIFWDETLTSEEALAKMIEAGRPQRKRRHLDDVAAALILQEYLDSR